MAASKQFSIRVVLARGGTSKGVYLHERDLPSARPARDALLLRLMGSPDALQIDGLGGARPITSKIAIVSVSLRPEADIDYTFAQVDIARASVGYDGNCGNILAGVGPFAVEEGLLAARDGHTTVRIHNTNTGKLIVAEVPTKDGAVTIMGDYVIPGVPGSGAEIAMNWADTVGAKTGRLLPTGSACDSIVLSDGRAIAVSLCDVANPCVWVRGADVGMSGSEGGERVEFDPAVRGIVRELRSRAAVLCGLAADWAAADRLSPGLPMIGIVYPPTSFRTLNGIDISADAMDVRVHLVFLGSLHESVAGTGSICLAAASRVPGSTVYETVRAVDGEVLRIGHPSGVTPTRVSARSKRTPPFVTFDELGFSRTSRRIMDGRAYVPEGLWSSDVA